MIKGDANQRIQEDIEYMLNNVAYDLTDEQKKLIILISKQIIQSFVENVEKQPVETESDIKLTKLKEIWKEFNKLLK